MNDLGPLDDIADLVQQVVDPWTLLEDFRQEPLKVGAAILGVIGAVSTMLTFLVLIPLLAFRFGILPVVAGLFVFSGVVTVLGFGLFLWARTDVPHRVQRTINRALASSDHRSPEASMSDEEAIDRLRDQYAEGEMTVEEFENGVEEIMQREDPQAVVREYERE